MSTKRTPINRPLKAKITPEAVALFREGLRLKAEGFSTIEVESQLDMALGRMKPWQISPLVATLDHPAAGESEQEWRHNELQEALAIRRELERAIEESEQP